MLKTFSSDVYRKTGHTRFGFQDWLLNRDLRILRQYRKASYWRKKKKIFKIFYVYHNLRLLHFSNKYEFNVPAAATIGPGLFISHNGPVTINGASIIGKNCNIGSGVTIGQENRGVRKGSPVIGDSVWIGTNAVIVGKITIGNNVLIAPNSYVNFDVPSNSIVIGNPGRIIPKSDATDKYIENKIE